MAKVPPKPPGSAKVKFRVFEFEMDGSDDSIQDTMKTLAAALTRGGQGGVPVARRLKAEPSGASTGNIPDVEEELEVEDEADESPIDDVVAKPLKERKSAAPRKSTPVKILPDISFTDVSPTLKEFVDQKRPGKAAPNNYLVVAYWYKHHRGIEDITVDHYHTAFREIGFATPKFAMAPIRELCRSSDGRLMVGSIPGTTKIHHLGENHVDAMNKAVD